MHGNGRPLGMRKRIQVLIAVVLLAWATQTLLHQWGFGAEIGRSDAAEKFVPGAGRYAAGATLELLGDATLFGAEVKLRQVCRWSAADAPVFGPVADLVIARLNTRSPFRSITIDQLRTTLRDAGMNLAVVRFAGPMSCTITRSDAAYDEQSALREWAAAKNPDAETRRREDAGIAEKAAQDPAPVPASPRPRVPASSSSVKTLQSLLTEDLSTRLGVPVEQLQISFNPKDEGLLRLAEPLFKFNIEPRQVHDLGEVSWSVLIFTGAGSQKGAVTANARAWQNQVVIEKPLGYHQVIRSSDVSERRVLVDRLPSDPVLTPSQVVGQEAGRDLKVGTVLSARMVDAVSLVKPGQLVTISLSVGTVRVKTVGRAMEGGSYGQAVKVRNDTTQDIYEVTMTGPQEGTMGPLPSPTELAESALAFLEMFMKHRNVCVIAVLSLSAGLTSAQTPPVARTQPRPPARQNVAPLASNNNMALEAAALMRQTNGSLLQAQLAAQVNPAQVQTSQVSFMAVPEPEPKLLRKHDLVTIIVNEQSEITSKGTSNVTRDSELDAKVDSFVKLRLKDLSLLGLQPTTTPEIKMSGVRSFQGQGDVERTDSFTARITAEVVDVKPNGTVVLQARKRIKTDEEEQQFILTGTCRAEDITAANSVLSTQLFDLELQKNHKGDVRNATRKGLLGKLLDVVNPF